MRLFAKRVLSIACLLAFCAATPACHPKGKFQPPPDDPKNPTLVTVADTAITVNFVKYALTNLPLLIRGRFMSEEGKNEFLGHLVDAASYYQEGLRRKMDKTADYQARIYNARKLIMVHMAKDKAYEASPPIDPAEVQKQYDQYAAREENQGRAPKAFSEIEASLRGNVEASRYRRAYRARVEELRKQYELAVSEEAVVKPVRELKLDMQVITSRAFNLSIADFLKWAETLPPMMKKQLTTEQGRRFLVDTYIENEMLYYDAVLQNLDKTEEYKVRTFVMEVNILGQMTADSITAKNIEASEQDARKWFDAHPDQFKGRTFADSLKEAKMKAGADKRARVTKELAVALRRDRYFTKFREDRVKELDLSKVTQGEIGLIAYPAVPQDAEDIDIGELLKQ